MNPKFSAIKKWVHFIAGILLGMVLLSLVTLVLPVPTPKLPEWASVPDGTPLADVQSIVSQQISERFVDGTQRDELHKELRAHGFTPIWTYETIGADLKLNEAAHRQYKASRLSVCVADIYVRWDIETPTTVKNVKGSRSDACL